MNEFSQPGGLSSLDQAFASKGLPTNSPKKAAQARLDWQLGGLLWRDVWNLAVEDKTITSFDAAVSKVLESGRYGVAKTKAKQLVKMVDDSQTEFLGKTENLPQFLEKRRKRMT